MFARRLPCFAVWVVLATAAALVALAQPATGHALLESTVPADGEELLEAPDQLGLRFSEPVSVPSRALRVHDSTGTVVDSGPPVQDQDGHVIRAELPDLDDGSYVVTWRVSSADGHPVRGAFVFTVGEGGGIDDSVIEGVFSGGADRPYAIAATAVGWLQYAGVLLAAGAVVFLGWVLPAGASEHGRLAATARTAAVVGVLAAVASVPLQTARTTGAGPDAFVRADLLAETLASSVGAQAIVQVVALAGLWWALRRSPWRSWLPWAAPAAAIAVGAFLLSGHTRTAEPRVVMVVADAVHLVTAAVWFGGLVLLTLALRHRRLEDDPVGGASLVARFSGLVTISVVALSLAGLGLAWVEVRALRALTSTTYGWTLVVKVALVALVLAIGAYNRQRLAPAVAVAVARRVAVPAGGSGDTMGPDRPAVPGGGPRDASAAWQRLARTVRVEALGLVAVLAVTAALVGLQPARDAAGVTGAYSTYVAVGAEHELNLVVDPNRAGFNEIHLYLLDRTGRTAAAEELSVELSLPAHDIGPIERMPTVAGPGHWILAGHDLAIPGTWQITVTARLTEFEEISTTLPVTVNP